MNPYHILYSLFYALSKKTNGSSNNPMYYACLGITTIVPMNLVTIILLLDVLFHADFISYMSQFSSYFIAFIYLFLLSCNYFYFHYANKKRKLVLYEGSFFKGRYIPANAMAVVYIVLSIMLLYVLAALGFNAKHGSS